MVVSKLHGDGCGPSPRSAPTSRRLRCTFISHLCIHLDTFSPRDMVLLGLAEETSDRVAKQTLSMVILCTSLDDHGPPPLPLVHDLCCVHITCGTGLSRETMTLPTMRRIDSGQGQIAASALHALPSLVAQRQMKWPSECSLPRRRGHGKYRV